MNNKSIVIFALIAGSAAAQNPARLGALSGLVVDESGRPLPGAAVHLVRAVDVLPPSRFPRPPRTESLPAQSLVRTDAGGRFGATGLPPGSYVVCTLGIQPDHLRSCISAAPYVEASASTQHKIVVVTGVVVRIRVLDPGKRVATETRFDIGVLYGSNHYARATLASRGNSEHLYQVAVPRGTRIRLWPHTRLNVSDPAGKALAKGRPTDPLPVAASGVTNLDLAVN